MAGGLTDERGKPSSQKNKRNLAFWIGGIVITILVIGMIAQNYFHKPQPTREQVKAQQQAQPVVAPNLNIKPRTADLQEVLHRQQQQAQAGVDQQKRQAAQVEQDRQAGTPQGQRQRQMQQSFAERGTDSAILDSDMGAVVPNGVLDGLGANKQGGDSLPGGTGLPTMPAIQPPAGQEQLLDKLLKTQTDAAGKSNGGGGATQNPSQQNQGFLDAQGSRPELAVAKIQAPPQVPTLMPGSVIPAVLITQINSALPGQVTAQVTQDVYDSINGTVRMIPAGSKLVGYYNSDVVAGQTRILLAFDTIEFPTGEKLDLKGMQAADAYGQSGLSDQTDNHFFQIFGSSFLIAAVSTALPSSQNTVVQNSGTGGTTQTSSVVGGALNNASNVALQRYQNLAPTLTERQGFRFNVMVNREVQFDFAAPPPTRQTVEVKLGSWDNP